MLITEGSGEDAKYYAQMGADTASKKLLGKQDLNVNLCAVNNASDSRTFKTVKEVTYVIMFRAGRNNISNTNLNCSGGTVQTLSSKLLNESGDSYGGAIVKVYKVTAPIGSTISLSITGTQYNTGCGVVVLS